MADRADAAATARSLPALIAAACPDVALAGPADAVAGRQAACVAAPASTGEAAALLAAAAQLGLAIVPRGSGSRLDWGAPPARCDLIVDTRRLDQVVEHAAGDLVVTAQAGVRLPDLARVLAVAGQRLALDPPGHETAGTVGGLVATGAAGPLRYRYGTPRDLLIGLTVIRADGTVARSGGKVVKNVAGYDLGKLFAGSYGTLGLITEVTFRLHPAPADTAWIGAEYADAAAAAAAVHAIADSPVAPSAIELDWPSAAAPISVTTLLEGDADSVRSRSARLEALVARSAAGQSSRQPKRLDNRPVPRPLPGQTSDADSPSDGGSGSSLCGVTAVRLGFWAGQLAAVLGAIRAAAERHGLDPGVSGAAAAGVLDVHLSGDAVAVAGFVTTLRARLAGLAMQSEHPGLPPVNASAVVVSAPVAVRESADVWGPVPALPLMRAIKDQFDPEHRMAPGRLAGGI